MTGACHLAVIRESSLVVAVCRHAAFSHASKYQNPAWLSAGIVAMRRLCRPKASYGEHWSRKYAAQAFGMKHKVVTSTNGCAVSSSLASSPCTVGFLIVLSPESFKASTSVSDGSCNAIGFIQEARPPVDGTMMMGAVPVPTRSPTKPKVLPFPGLAMPNPVLNCPRECTTDTTFPLKTVKKPTHSVAEGSRLACWSTGGAKTPPALPFPVLT
jgi:hypothetical protein